MELEEGLVTWLKAQSPVPASGRIYPAGTRPKQGSVPAITYLLVSDVPSRSLSGPSGLARARLQLDHWESTALLAKTRARTVRLLIDGYSGSMGTVAVTSISRLNTYSNYDPKAKEHRTIVDYLITYKET